MTFGLLMIQAIINGIFIGFVYSVISLGLTLIWGTMGIINFAHGDFVMLGMYISFFLFSLGGIDPIFSIPIVMIISFGVGIIYYKGIIRTVLAKTKWSQILATFGIGIALQSLALFFFSPNYRSINGHILSGNIVFGKIAIGNAQLFTSIICSIGIFSLFYFLNKTKTGRAIKATSINKEAALLVGINIEKINLLVVGIGISLAGLAGSLLSNFYYIFPQVGLNFGIFAYIVVCLGGFGSVQGALIGGLLLGIVSSLTGTLLDPALKYAVVFLVYIIVIVIKPKGLKGW